MNGVCYHEYFCEIYRKRSANHIFLTQLKVLTIDEIRNENIASWAMRSINGKIQAFLQYTSGSTGVFGGKKSHAAA